MIKTTALALTIALALSLSPAAAFAESGEASLAAGAAAVSTQKADGGSTVWVRELASSSVRHDGKKYAMYTYNANHLLLAKHRYHESHMDGVHFCVASYQYDGKGRLAKLTEDDKTSKTKRVNKLTYDKKGRLVRQDVRYTFSPGNKSLSVLTYKHSSNGRKVACTGVDMDGNHKVKRTITLNAKGYVTSVAERQYFKTYAGDGAKASGKYTPSDKAKFTYKYDSKGNLVKRTGDFGVLGWSNAGNETYRNKLNDMGDIRYVERKGAKTGRASSG